jgi:PAS domain S-box-containing protein
MQRGDELYFDENRFIVSKTDLTGNIIYANDLLIEISGYSEQELMGASHNIVRHPDMPRAVFQLLWDKIQAGDEIFAYVKNRAKSGKHYWVHSYFTPMYDAKSGSIIGYHSVRRSPSTQGIAAIEPIYRKMLEAEKNGGIQSSIALLEKTLSDLKVSYAEFLLSYE